MVQLKQILGLGSLAFLSFGCAQLECKNEVVQSQSIVQDRIQRRSLEVGTWFMPQVMYKSMARGSIDNFNGDELTVFYFSKPMNYKSQLVTGNNNSPYVHLFHNLKKTGPVVVDFPAAGDEGAFFGTFLDSWHKPIVDVGPDGADKGEGGKYFIYGPDFEGKVPKGYIPVPQETYMGYMSLRSLTKGTTDQDFAKSEKYIQKIQVYPYGKKQKTHHIDQYNIEVDMTIDFSFKFWEDVDYMLQNEIIKHDEKAFYGMLKTLGLEKGKKFEPNDHERSLLEEAAKELHIEMKHDLVEFAPKIWPGKSNWTIPVPMSMMTTDATYVSSNWNDYVSRGATFYFYFAPPASLADSKSTTYIKGAKDSEGRVLNGQYDYQITIPAEVPARRFWSMLTYSNDTGAYVKGAPNVGIASNESGLKTNADGTVTLTWTSKITDNKPNCLYVRPGEDFFTLFRLYGPEKAFFDGTFNLPNIKRIK